MIFSRHGKLLTNFKQGYCVTERWLKTSQQNGVIPCFQIFTSKS